jgi:hypothetical protein
MKRLFAALTLALLVSLALAVSAANATHSEGNGPEHDFVSGTGQNLSSVITIEREVHVNARRTPSGDVQGYFSVRQEGFSNLDFRGEVTCLTVEGNRARVVGEITQSKDEPGLEGLGFLLSITDRGEGSDDPNDGLSYTFVAQAPQVCPIPPGSSLPFNTTQGNFVVHDATP